MSIFGSAPVFDCKSDEWTVHKAQLNNFFEANDITNASDTKGIKRRAILLNCMSQDSYRLARDLLFPETPETASYSSIVAKLDTHFGPRKCVYAERENFYSANKETHETMMEYAARLRGLSSGCEFGTALEMCLTDRFVLGIDSKVIREKLYREDATQLRMARALELASAIESAQRMVSPTSCVKTEPLMYKGVHRASGGGVAGAVRRREREPRAGSAAGDRCGVCGARAHHAADCGFRNLCCDFCGVKGHLKRMCTKKSIGSNNCLSKNRKDYGRPNNYFVCDSSAGDTENSSSLNNIHCTDEKPMVVEVRVCGKAFKMEVDSGSAVSVLPAAVWREYLAKNTAICKANKILRTYDGSVVHPMGMCTVPVCYESKSRDVTFYVVENGPVSLLGRDFLSKFNMALVALNYCTLNEKERIFSRYDYLFSGELGTFNKYKLSLNLKEGATPKFCKARPVPFALKQKISDELDRLVRSGILKPVSYSKYASPIVAVLKKNNEVRICGDYSGTINKDLKVDSYPLPKINDLCVSLHGCRYFSKLDLSNSYNQFLLDDKSQEYTCINTHMGLFCYTRLVFGLANAPALFQRAIVQLLRGIDGVECFLDDILVAAPTEQLHWKRVEEVLSRLREAGLVLQRSKCSFFQDRIEYLGYVIDRNGLHKNPEKIKAILNARAPENVKQLKSFLGIINFYHTFVPHASALLEPLHSLLRKDVPWEWSSDQQQAFESIKRELGSERVLAHFDPRQLLVLTVDAAPGGLGAVLAVRSSDGSERPLCYASRSLCKSERAYSQIQKEATAIVYGIKKFHQYLYGREKAFILRTDHKPLISIFSPDKGVPHMTEARLQRYALFLAAYNYKIEFVSSEKNVADYLSRCPVDTATAITDGEDAANYVNILAAAACAALPASPSELRSAVATDGVLSQVVRYVVEGWPKRVRPELLVYRKCQHELHVDNGILLRGHRVVVPGVFQKGLIQELHAAHLGVIKMKMAARERCWYPTLDKDIEHLVANCERCVADRATPPKTKIESWEWPNSVFERVHLDFMGPYHGKMYLILIDAHSKWLECIEVPNLTVQTLIGKLQTIFTHFGLPCCIVSDNAKTFISKEFKTFCSVYNIKQIFSPVYSPQCNGLAENAVRICKRFINNAIKDGPAKQIDYRLNQYLFHYRNTPHCTTGVSPATLMFGRNLRCKLDSLTVIPQGQPQQSAGVEYRVRTYQGRQQKYFRGIKKQLSINDKVWIKDYRGSPQKPKWILGRVVARVGKVVYDVSVSGSDIVWRRHANQIMNANSYSQIDVGDKPYSSSWTYDSYNDIGTPYQPCIRKALEHSRASSPDPETCVGEGDGASDSREEGIGMSPSSGTVSAHEKPKCTRSGRIVVPPKQLQ